MMAAAMKIRPYLSYFRIRFLGNLQYRTAAWAGLATQFAWGFMMILLYRAFYRSNPMEFPMTFESVAAYIWLQQALLTFYSIWSLDTTIFSDITDGNLAYELLRPLDLYSWWFAKNVALRTARATLRIVPVLLVAFLLPQPYGLTIPASWPALLMFLLTLFMTLGLVIAYTMLVYIGTIRTLNPQGLRVISISLADLLTGAIVPLPFMPERVQRVLAWTPFSVMQNLPFRIYSGDIGIYESLQGFGRQILWLAILVLLGRRFMQHSLRRVVLQGG